MLPAICIALVVVIAIAAIPRSVWSLILEHSLDSRGRLRLRYVWREVGEASNFFAGFVLSFLLLTTLLIGLTVLMDARTRAAEQSGMLDDSGTGGPNDWNALVSAQRADVFSAMSRRPLIANSSPPINSSNLLWIGMFVSAAITVAGAALVARITSRGYRLPMDQWVVELSAKNRQRIANRYLRTTAQSDARWHRQEERNRDGGPPNRSQQNA
jgi:hypothetical protein